MQPKVIDFKAYKRAKGIAPLRSPYSTLAATEEEIHEALNRAADTLLAKPHISVVHAGCENIKQDVLRKCVYSLANRPSFPLHIRC